MWTTPDPPDGLFIYDPTPAIAVEKSRLRLNYAAIDQLSLLPKFPLDHFPKYSFLISQEETVFMVPDQAHGFEPCQINLFFFFDFPHLAKLLNRLYPVFKLVFEISALANGHHLLTPKRQ